MSDASHLNQVRERLRTLMEYRNTNVRQRLEEVRWEASMLHVDVLLLIYHFERSSPGNVFEIRPYVGGSTIAAAFGARESDTPKKIFTIEAGGSLKHFRLSSRNIIKDLKKNLANFGVAQQLTLINGRSSDETIIAEIHQRLASREVGLFIFDAETTCAGIWIRTATWCAMAVGSSLMITLGRRKSPRFAHRLTGL